MTGDTSCHLLKSSQRSSPFSLCFHLQDMCEWTLEDAQSGQMEPGAGSHSHPPRGNHWLCYSGDTWGWRPAAAGLIHLLRHEDHPIRGSLWDREGVESGVFTMRKSCLRKLKRLLGREAVNIMEACSYRDINSGDNLRSFQSQLHLCFNLTLRYFYL